MRFSAQAAEDSAAILGRLRPARSPAAGPAPRFSFSFVTRRGARALLRAAASPAQRREERCGPRKLTRLGAFQSDDHAQIGARRNYGRHICLWPPRQAQLPPTQLRASKWRAIIKQGPERCGGPSLALRPFRMQRRRSGRQACWHAVRSLWGCRGALAGGGSAETSHRDSSAASASRVGLARRSRGPFLTAAAAALSGTNLHFFDGALKAFSVDGADQAPDVFEAGGARRRAAHRHGAQQLHAVRTGARSEAVLDQQGEAFLHRATAPAMAIGGRGEAVWALRVSQRWRQGPR